MRVLHTSVMSELAIGVVRQLEAENNSAKALGLEWTIKFFSDQPLDSPFAVLAPVSSVNRAKFKMAYYRWLMRTYKDFDVLVLRYCVHDPFQMLFLLWCRRPIYFVHHTMEGPELGLSNQRTTKLKVLLERVIGSISLSLVDGVIAVTPQMLQYEMDRRLIKRNIPSHVYSNGIEYKSDPGDEHSKNSRTEQISETQGINKVGVLQPETVATSHNAHETLLETPVLLFVSSSYQIWQGLEELVEAAAAYKGQFICHIVGNLSDTQQVLLSKDARFILHGSLDKEAIRLLISQSDVGLDGLALFKKNMVYGSTLKAREYLMEGLAVYAGHKDVFAEDFPYYKNGDIDMGTIVQYAKDSRLNDRAVVSTISRPYIDKLQMLSQLHQFLLENYKSG